MYNDVLIRELRDYVESHMSLAKRWKQLSIDALNARPDAQAWSALECLEHLNLYGDFYLPELAKRIRNASRAGIHQFRPGLLGSYFANSMLPNEKLNRMKTFANKNPSGSALSIANVDRFIDQQSVLLELLQQAEHINLNRTKTAISISSVLKLKIGDTLRFVIYHNERHMQQALRAIASAK